MVDEYLGTFLYFQFNKFKYLIYNIAKKNYYTGVTNVLLTVHHISFKILLILTYINR